MNLIDGLAEVFPETSSYGGKFAEPIPHLTVAEVTNPNEIRTVTNQFIKKAEGILLIVSSVSAITLMEYRVDQWHPREEFPLGPASGFR